MPPQQGFLGRQAQPVRRAQPVRWAQLVRESKKANPSDANQTHTATVRSSSMGVRLLIRPLVAQDRAARLALLDRTALQVSRTRAMRVKLVPVASFIPPH
jgi:hypothetical protein